MLHRTRLGVLIPSSNVAMEPILTRMIADLPDVSAHFGRFSVTEIGPSEREMAQFELEPRLAAAELLAQAKVQVIGWIGGTGWVGFDSEQRLCDEITRRTGVPAMTAILALRDLFKETGVQRFGLVSPYLAPIQQRCIETFAGAGFECVAERHADLRDNFAFSEVTEAEIERMTREVAQSKPDAITFMNTNFRSASVAARLERELGIPMVDLIALGVATCLKMAGADPGRISGWGALFNRP